MTEYFHISYIKFEIFNYIKYYYKIYLNKTNFIKNEEFKQFSLV